MDKRKVIVDLGNPDRYSELSHFQGVRRIISNGELVMFSDLENCPDAPSCEECKEKLKMIIKTQSELTVNSDVQLYYINKAIDDMPFTEEVKDETS